MLARLAGPTTQRQRPFPLYAMSISSCPVLDAPALPIHPNVQPVFGLLGQWNGSGKGSFPTLPKSFEFEEELLFANHNKPFVSYTQRTWAAGSDRSKPMHEENGFLRFVGGEAVEALITQCTGVQEQLAGRWVRDESLQTITITLDSTGVVRTPSAKEPHVTQVQRVYTFNLDGDSLSYTVSMATATTPLTVHLQGQHGRLPPKPVADDDQEEEEMLEDIFLEPDVVRHPPHDHTTVATATQTTQ